MDEKTIARINELYHKSKGPGLSPEEKAEQDRLRKEYIAAVRGNLKGALDSMKIQNPDGTIVDVKKRHDEKMKSHQTS